ncbi:MAG: type I pantothenate kinase [Enterobacteriaceae bacterium]
MLIKKKNKKIKLIISRLSLKETLRFIPKKIIDLVKYKFKKKNIINLKELFNIYLPISKILNYKLDNFKFKKKIKYENNPFIIGITGSVSVGKTTTAKILKKLLNCWKKKYKIEIISTDGFLYSSKLLKKKKIIRKKGFPESYNKKNIINFLKKIKKGKSFNIPKYSHKLSNVHKKKKIKLKNLKVLIIEGINIFQKNFINLKKLKIYKFINYIIYINASENLTKKWYMKRHIKLKNKKINILKLEEKWTKTNLVNLKKNILKTKEYANIIINKKNNHFVKNIKIIN